MLSGADFLCLAAAPTFAGMAALTVVSGASAPEMMCPAGHADGMASMYLLMSLFHVAPWLKLIACRRR